LIDWPVAECRSDQVRNILKDKCSRPHFSDKAQILEYEIPARVTQGSSAASGAERLAWRAAHHQIDLTRAAGLAQGICGQRAYVAPNHP